MERRSGSRLALHLNFTIRGGKSNLGSQPSEPMSSGMISSIGVKSRVGAFSPNSPI